MSTNTNNKTGGTRMIKQQKKHSRKKHSSKDFKANAASEAP
jgi:hypothetical protein